MIQTGKKTNDSRKTFPSATMSTTIVSWTGPRPNPGLRGERPKASGNMCSIQPEQYTIVCNSIV
jgi:hypothetical protein